MVEFILSIIGLTILLGFLGNVLFEKTSIPNTLWLLFFGVLLGLTGFLSREVLLGSAGFVSALAVIGILSDGGLHLDLKTIFSQGALGFALMAAGLLFSIVAAAGVMVYFNYPVLVSVFVGIALAGTSSSVIIPLVMSMKNVSPNLKTILSLESIFDTFSIVIALLLVDFLATDQLAGDAANSFIQQSALGFFSAIAIGIIFGFFWSPLIVRLKKYEFSYSATLGMLVLLYAFAGLFGSSGAIAVFFAGIMLANAHIIFNAVSKKTKFEKLDTDISKTHSLFAFLLRVFFFVFLGVIVAVPEINFLVLGLVIVVLMVAGRVFYLNVFSRLKIVNLAKKENRLYYIMVSRGLSSAVLSTVALSAGVPFAQEIVQIVFSVILFSIIVTTLGVFVFKDRRGAKDESLQEISFSQELD